MGYCTVTLEPGRPVESPAPVVARVTRRGIVLENEHLRLRIDGRGEIAELYDKAARRQLVPPGAAMNHLELYRDNPSNWDAWDVEISYKQAPVPLGPAQRVAVVADGPVEARVEVRRRVGNSSLRQEIVLRAGGRRIDFHTWVDWRERHRLLKVAFPAELRAVTLRGEIQFGHVVRPAHRNTLFERQRFEWPAQRWADVSEANFGMALLNDCKYGYDLLDGVLRLSLLRAPISPDPQADRGRHEFTYALLVHDGPFTDGRTVRAGYELNAPALVRPGAQAGLQGGLLELSAGPAVIVETVKRGETGRDTIVRLYEALGTTADAAVRLAARVRSAHECDLLETPLRELNMRRDGGRASQTIPDKDDSPAVRRWWAVDLAGAAG